MTQPKPRLLSTRQVVPRQRVGPGAPLSSAKSPHIFCSRRGGYLRATARLLGRSSWTTASVGLNVLRPSDIAQRRLPGASGVECPRLDRPNGGEIASALGGSTGAAESANTSKAPTENQGETIRAQRKPRPDDQPGDRSMRTTIRVITVGPNSIDPRSPIAPAHGPGALPAPAVLVVRVRRDAALLLGLNRDGPVG